MANSKKEAKELSCLFGFLIQDYQKSKLAKCETSKNQKWRNANAPLVKYLPKLFLLLDSLNEYSKLEKFGNSKNGLPNNNANFCNFGIQVALPNFESESFVKKINEVKNLNKQLLLENEKLKKILGNKFDNQQERVEAILNTSISDEPISQKSINIPEILVPDPLSINPNSIDNIRKILDHIQEISGISKGTQKWIVV
ncbi:13916_t:CDS:2, partial [Gigaspora rosea]